MDKEKKQSIDKFVELRRQDPELEAFHVEREKSYETLRETKELLEKILSTTYLLIAYMDMDFNFIHVNHAYAEMGGHDPDFFVGKNHFDLYPNEDNEAIFRQTVETGEAYSVRAKAFEYKDYPERGVTYWDWDLHPIKDAAGEVEGLLLCLVDVTERIRAEEELKGYQDQLEELVEKRTEELRRANEKLTTEMEEHRKTAEDLRKSEEMFRLVTETIPDVLWMSTPGIEKMIYVSPAYEEVWGCSRDSLYGSPKSFIDAVHPEDRQKVMDEAKEHAKGKWDIEYRIIRPDGSICWIRDRGSPVLDERGKLYLMAGVARDITLRRQIEEKLKESRGQYRLLFESTPDGVIFIKADGEITSVNPAGAEILGFESPEELIGKKALDLYLDPSEREIMMAEARKKGFLENYEIATVKKDGTTAYLISSITVRKDSRDNILRLEAVFKDITQQKMVMTELREDRNHLAVMLEEKVKDLEIMNQEVQRSYEIQSAINSLMNFSLRDVTLEETLNKALDIILSISRLSLKPAGGIFLALNNQKLVMKSHKGLPKQLQVVCAEVPFDKCFCGKAASTREIQFGDYSEECHEFSYEGMIPHANYAIPITSGHRIIGVISLHLEQGYERDKVEEEFLSTIANVLAGIIERKEMEDELEVERKSLARRVAERTAELRSANKELERADRLKDEFLAAMSHELRTPISGILGMCEVLNSEVYGPLNQEQVSSLHDIEESGRHLLDLINDILDVSKIQVGQMELEIRPLDVKQVCEASLRFIERDARKKRLRVSSSFDSSVTILEGDERRLKQILVNLLTNAVKFTPDGGSIGIEVMGDQEQEMINFTVWDTGIGIPGDQLERLFEPFTQLDSSLSRRHAGTGLGLSLVKRLVEMHDGRLSVETEVGKGSRFTFVIPWSMASESLLLTDSSDSSQSRMTGVRRALVVEDSPSAAENLALYLSELGAETLILPEGEGAVEMSAETQPDVIILDIMLPDITGWDVLVQLKEDQRTRDIPVVIVTVVDDRPRGMMLGADDYLVKPISRRQFRSALGRVLPSKPREAKALIIGNEEDPDMERPLILLAEDNEVSMKSISDYLSASGFQVIAARNGKEAMELVKEKKPDLVLMDIQMPDMDGLEAIRHIRSDPDIANIPAVALTALAMPGDREKCMEAGANGYISKPVSLRELVDMIKEQLNA